MRIAPELLGFVKVNTVFGFISYAFSRIVFKIHINHVWKRYGFVKAFFDAPLDIIKVNLSFPLIPLLLFLLDI